jgi:hypothetical protein
VLTFTPAFLTNLGHDLANLIDSDVAARKSGRVRGPAECHCAISALAQSPVGGAKRPIGPALLPNLLDEREITRYLRGSRASVLSHYQAVIERV